MSIPYQSTVHPPQELPQELSAHRRLSRGQAFLLWWLAGLTAVAAVVQVGAVVVAFVSLTTGLYLLSMIHRAILLRLALRDPSEVRITEREALALSDADLPIYTILVPAYHEARVIGRTLSALEQLSYPRERLDIKLLLEADDFETIDAARAARSALVPEIVLVVPGQPRTKPKACNQGLARAKGDLITIYDAEDRPDPLQLRRAVATFRRLRPDYACLQAKLSYHNAHQNLLTRWFTAEYETWFSLMLPALARLGGPVLLGGTSMHIRRAVLDAVGGWDSYNVTEDADLGVRLQRLGYKAAVLDSTTLEEANSDIVNWVRQRSRWYKGYLQTWLVHMRHPIRLWHEIGGAAFAGVNILLGIVPLLAVLNPIFWLLTALWFLVQPTWLAALLPAPTYYAALIAMLGGNFLAVYMNLIAISIRQREDLLLAVLVSPLYWAMMSLAAVRAFVQLVVAPSFWEKSVHGLDSKLAGATSARR